MKKGTIIGLGVGLAGSIATYVITRKYYEQKISKIYEEFTEEIKQLGEDTQVKIDELNKKVEEQAAVIATPTKVEQPKKPAAKKKVVKKNTDSAVDYNAITKKYQTESADTDIEEPKAPQEITSSEFGKKPYSYEMDYYDFNINDGKFYDQDGRELLHAIDDISEIHAKKIINGDVDEIYVRNFEKKLDICISRYAIPD